MPSFDGDTLTITLDSGVTSVDTKKDLYSDWKEFVKVGDNAKYLPAFRAIGGDPLTPELDAGAYFFLRNDLGWRIKPPEEDITINITGNLVPQDPALPILIPTTGNFRVIVLGLQPVTQGTDVLIDKQTLLQRLIQNRTETNPETGVMTIYADDNTTPLFTANIFEDIAGNTPYRGSGVERRDRLA